MECDKFSTKAVQKQFSNWFAEMFKKTDEAVARRVDVYKRQPVHYEGAQGVNGEPDPKTVDVISRFYTRVKQEYLNPGIPEGEDKDCLLYTSRCV